MIRAVWLTVCFCLGVLSTALAVAAQTPAAAAPAEPEFTLPRQIEMSPVPKRAEQKGEKSRPNFAGRIVTRFDFEERSTNPEEVPFNWFRAQHNPPQRERLGFPAFNRAAFDHSQGFGGSASSVMLPTRGGSTSLRLAPGTLVIFSDAEYRVSAQVKTQGLVNARAAIETTLLDEQRRPIPGSARRSALIISENEWTSVSMPINGGQMHASYLQIELLLLQPDQLHLDSKEARRNWANSQDLQGAVWFDDVSILQLPRVAIRTGVDGNVFFAPNKPAVEMDVRDLTGDDLTTELVVLDIDEQVVSRKRIAVPRGGTSARASLDLPRFGWFRVQMNLVGIANVPMQASLLGETTLIWVPGGPTSEGNGIVSPLRPFSLFAENISTDAMATLPRLTARLGFSRLTIGLPTDRAPSSPEPADALKKTLDALATSPLDFTLAITRLPIGLSDRLRADPTMPISLGGAEPSQWTDALSSWIGESAQRVASWQIGPSVQPTILDHDSIVKQIGVVRSGISRISPNPRMILPWTADSQWIDSTAGNKAFAAATIAVPASFASSAIAPALDTFSRLAGDGLDLTYVVEPLPQTDYERRPQVEHALQHAIELWRRVNLSGHGHQTNVGILSPWTIGADRQIRPEPMLAAASVLANLTDSMKLIGDVPTDPGVRGIVLAPASGNAIGSLGLGSGLMIAWSEDAASTNPTITGFFGGGVLKIIDAFGNESSLPANKATGKHTIPVGPLPTYVSGIDSHLVRFLADIKVQPGFIPAVVANHDCEIVLKNPWPTRITGDVMLINPDIRGNRRDQSWLLSPTNPMPFSIGPGQTVRVPFTFQFTSAEEAGSKQIPMVVRLSADRSYPSMRLSKPINIGLEDLDLQVTAQLGPTESGPDVIITTTTTNSGKLTRTLQLTSAVVGYPSQNQPIVDLAPGESAVRRFVFRNAAEALSGRRARVMLVDLDGAERMTKNTMIP